MTHYVIWMNQRRVANTQSLPNALRAPYDYATSLVEVGRLRVERVDPSGEKRDILVVDLDVAPTFAEVRT